jgi:hypothetical protein
MVSAHELRTLSIVWLDLHDGKRVALRKVDYIQHQRPASPRCDGHQGQEQPSKKHLLA